jgi:flagellar assembly protein FliH
MSEAFVLQQLDARGEIVGAGVGPAERAAEIVAAAEARAAVIEADARESGLEIGRREGRAAAEAEAAELRRTLLTAIQAIDGAREEFLAEAELHAVELALAVAEKVVCAALELEPQRVCDVVSGALRRIADRDRVVLELNPDDVELVRAWLDAGSTDWGRIELHTERRVPRGGCVARTAEGEIDARTAEQLEQAGELLRQAFATRLS